jgi:hypothetical protein
VAFLLKWSIPRKQISIFEKEMSPMKLRSACVLVGFLSLVPLMVAQTTAETTSALPRLVRFGGTVKDLNRNPLTGVVGITFALYSEQTGGSALWLETQNITADSNGHYTALLGSTKPDGLPTELFTSEQARWVGVQVSGQAEQPRVLLVSVPYALRALDAETVGGRPASAFMPVPNSSASGSIHAAMANGAVAQSGVAPALSGGGTKDYVPLWTNSTGKLGNSVMFQSGAGGTANIGINTTTPAQKLEVDLGNLLVKGTDNFKAAGDTAYVHVGDTNHSIEAQYDTGLAIGVYKVPSALFIQDKTGNVGIGTSTPTSAFSVSGNSNSQIVAVTQTGSGNGIAASTAAPTSAAVSGLATDETCNTEPCSAGVLGKTKSVVHSAGVMGIVSGRSNTGLSINNGAAIWGDTNVELSAAVPILGTTDDNIAVSAINNGADAVSLQALNFSTTGGDVFYAAQAGGDGYCEIDTSGDLFCSGSKSAVVPLKSGHKVALYAVEAPENWFEDFGTSELRGGSAVISLDPAFTQTVNAGAGYHVFLTPKGDCHGLYVSQETPTSFAVHELGGGTSNIAFDYRITARRKGYENIRLADVTEHINRLQRSIPKLNPVRAAE